MREKRKKKQQQLTNSAVSAGGESLFLMFRMCIKGLNLDCQEILFHLQRWDSRNSSVFLCSNKMQTSRPLISKVVFGSLLHVTCNFVCVGEVTATTAGAVACHLLLSLLTRWNIHLIWQEETFFSLFSQCTCHVCSLHLFTREASLWGFINCSEAAAVWEQTDGVPHQHSTCS